MPRALSRVVQFSAMLVLGACQDLSSPVSPEVSSPAASLTTPRIDNGKHLGGVPFVCKSARYTGATGAAWATQRGTLFFPRSELREDGLTVRYVLRQHTPDGALRYAAFCDVPYTEPALRRIDRHFGVQKSGGAEQFVARERENRLSCVIGGVCMLEPLVVEAEATPHEEPDLCAVDSSGNEVCGPTHPDGGGGPTPPSTECETQPHEGSGSCDGDVPPEEEEEAKSCPSLIIGKTVTALVPVTGRNHEFRFVGSVREPLVRVSGPRSPATYEVRPTLSEDGWWMAESGTIKVNCSGGYSPSAFGYRLFLGTTSYAGQSDLHMVMGPGHPSF